MKLLKGSTVSSQKGISMNKTQPVGGMRLLCQNNFGNNHLQKEL